MKLRGKYIAAFGIVTYIVMTLSSIENDKGEMVAPMALMAVALLMTLAFFILATIRIWIFQKWGPIWLVTFTLLTIALSFVGGVPYLLINIGNVLYVLAYLWVIVLLFAVERVEQNLPLSSGEMPEIGKHLHWLKIVNHALRVIDLDRSGTTIDENGQVQGKVMFKPYGYLIVESPILDARVRLRIIHRDDFLLANRLIDLFNGLDEESGLELLVCYSPETLMPNGFSGTWWHCLHFAVKKQGTLEQYYSVNGGVHIEAPDPELLFGTFVYVGEANISMPT